LLTPNGWAFAIWGAIFLGEGLYAIYQMFPNVRNSKEANAIGWPYVGSCVAQCLWTVVFAQDLPGIALIFMVLILVALAVMQYRLYRIDTAPGYLNYWLLEAGPLLHLGWIVLATTLNVNVVIVASRPVKVALNATSFEPYVSGTDNEENAIYQISASIVSLSIVVSLALFQSIGLLLLSKSPVFPHLSRAGWSIPYNPTKAGTVPAVAFSWALFGIYSQLETPKDKTVLQFSPVVLSGVKYASFFAACLVAVSVALNVVLVALNTFVPSLFTSEVKEQEWVERDVENQEPITAYQAPSSSPITSGSLK